MRYAAIALSLATLLGAAAPALAQNNSGPPTGPTGPQSPIGQPGTANVPNPSSGTASSSSGMTRPGGNAGNSASRPEPQRGSSADPGALTTEAPSLEMREVGPGARPDQTPTRP
jgi:hypothetical protein